MFRIIYRVIGIAVFACIPGSAAVGQDNAQCVGDTIPTTMVPGLQYNVSVTFKNTGTTTWTSAGGYKLGAAGDSDPLSGPGRVDLGGSESIGLNQQKTFNFTLTAPLSVGFYITDWRMVREGVTWFGETLVREVHVTYGLEPPGAPVVTLPLAGSVIGANRPDIAWTGDACDAYEIRISSYNMPDSADGWSSGVVPVTSSVSMATSGPLIPEKTYYVFVRLRNPNGWSPWSASYRSFYVAGEFLNDPYFVAGPSGAQYNHSICYNPDRNEYLVTYYDAKPNIKRKVAYCRLDGNGVRIGEEVVVEDDMGGTHAPAVAYNSVDKEYLIIYTGWMDYGYVGDLLYAQRVNANTGAKIGGAYCIHNCTNWSPGIDRDPSLAYSPVNNVYLAVWANGGTADVYGLRINGATGTPIGSEFDLTPGDSRLCAVPDVTYNSIADEFYVVFQLDNGAGTGWDVGGRRVRASDGALQGSLLTLVNTPAWEMGPHVTHDSHNNRYLVAYGGAGVWAQFVTAAGTLDGARFNLATPPLSSGGMPSPEYHPVTREFVVCWMNQDSESSYGRRLTQTGAFIGEPFRINGDILFLGNWDPIPVANPVSGEFLLCWYNSYDNVYVRRYKTRSAPAADATPPAAVGNFTAAASAGRVTLSWTNPSDPDFAGTIIKFSTTSYPAGPSSGTLVVDKPGLPGSADSFVHDKLGGATTYYYSAFARDEVPNYSPARNATATPPITSETTINSSTFDSGADGWTAVGWRAIPDYELGKMEWNNSGNPGGCMRATGAGQTDNSERCLREGGEIRKVISTAGFHGIKVYYDLKVNALGGNYTGSGTGGCTVDHNLIDEQITVFYSTNGGTSWIEAGYLKRSELLAGYLNNYGARMIDLSGVADVNNNPNFALRFRWQFNTWADAGYLDNIVVTGSLHSFAAAKALPNGSPISVLGKGLYLKRSTFAYIEEPDRSGGIRIKGSVSGNEGDRVSIRGTMQTESIGGERVIQVDAMTIDGQLAISPLGMNNRDLKASMPEGMFVKTWGLVKPGSITSNAFVLTDGSDDTGIRVLTVGAPGVSEGDYVAASGAAGIINGIRVIYRK